METDAFLTIQGPSEGFYKEKGSKFYASAYPVNNEEDIKEFTGHLRKKFLDARHHCYAWVLGADHARFRSNDDGEPGHSAGDPILGRIRSGELTNVLIVVVRYFGGTKLGISGLIRAYKTAASDALDHAIVRKVSVTVPVRIIYGYESTTVVMKLVDELKLEIKNRVFEHNCIIEAEIKVNLIDMLKKRAGLLIGQGIEVEFERKL